jgi:hypothetical protein
MLVRSGVAGHQVLVLDDRPGAATPLSGAHPRSLKQWKLSPMDLQSRVRWEDYTKAKEEMLARTNIPEAPWYIVEGNDKRRRGSTASPTSSPRARTRRCRT